MSSHLIADTNIHPIVSLLFGTNFLGAAWVGILSGLVLLALFCEDVPYPNKHASLLHVILGGQLDLENNFSEINVGNNYCIENVLIFITF
jgi:hypothetical protein